MCETPFSHNNEKQLLAAFEQSQAGDPTELQILLAGRCAQLAPRFRNWIPGDLLRSFDVEDLIQETCIRAMRSVHAFDWSQTGGFDSWLTEIARNCLIDAVRKARRKKRGGDKQNVPLSWLKLDEHLGLDLQSLKTASQAVHLQQIVQDIRQAVGRLPDRERRAVLLHYLREVEPTAAAAKMEITPGAFRALLQRARERLRAHLRESAWFPK